MLDIGQPPSYGLWQSLQYLCGNPHVERRQDLIKMVMGKEKYGLR